MSKNNDTLKVGIAGLGTVGKGVFKILENNAKLITQRAGRKIEVIAVSSRDKKKNRGLNLEGVTWYENATDLANDNNVDVVIELIGGATGIAADVVKKSIKAKKHVVSANKALVAKSGVELATIAESNGKAFLFEASVAGGIPILKSIREGLAGNSFKKIAGILNGTCNFILTKMKREGRTFDSVLREAQELGYAEADPSFDIDGVDAAHKLAVISALAFGIKPSFNSIYIEGIRKITSEDIKFAEMLGYNIRLLAIASSKGTGSKAVVEQRVHPCLLQKDAHIGNVEGVLGAVFVETDNFGKGMFVGAGAGELPTASAVVADLVDIARGNYGSAFSVPAETLTDAKFSSIDEHEGEYYIRLRVKDKDGVLSSITSILAKNKIGFGKVHQEPVADAKNKEADVVLVTHLAKESQIKKSIDEIDAQKYLVEEPTIIRVEAV